MTSLKPFVIATVVALASGSATSAADHRDGSIAQDQPLDLADTYIVNTSIDSSFAGVETDLDADLTYSVETTDSENQIVRK